jgi:uncharacterized membrane protein
MKKSLIAKAFRGFFILLPFLIAYLMLGQLVDTLLALTQPMIDVAPGVVFKTEGARRLVAFGVLIVICIFVAVVADTTLARRAGTWFENAVMSRFPPYTVLKSLSARLSGKKEEKLQPALLEVSDGVRVLVAIVERLPDGNVTVFAPIAPTPALGLLQIVDPSKLEELQCSMSDALGWTLNWGAGTQALLGGVKDSPS